MVHWKVLESYISSLLLCGEVSGWSLCKFNTAYLLKKVVKSCVAIVLSLLVMTAAFIPLNITTSHY